MLKCKNIENFIKLMKCLFSNRFGCNLYNKLLKRILKVTTTCLIKSVPKWEG